MTNSTPQEPAEGILKTHDFGNSKVYTVACSCGNSDDNIDIDIEADDCGVTVHHHVKVKTSWWDTPTHYSFINGFLHRVKMTYNLWINGYLEYESWTIMTPQQTINYAHTLTQASEDVQKFRETHKQQS